MLDGTMQGLPTATLVDALGPDSTIIGGPFGSDLTQADYTADGVPVLRVSNQVDGDVVGPFAYVSSAKADKLAKNSAAPGDIIVTQRGSTVGKVSRLKSDHGFETFIVSQSQMAIRVSGDAAHPDFVFQYLRSELFRRYVDRSAIQTGQPHINLEILRKAPIALPPLPEQRRIAGILRTWDEAIDAASRLIDAKRRRLDAIRENLLRADPKRDAAARYGDFMTESRVEGGHGASARKITVRLYGKGAAAKDDRRAGSANTKYYRRSAGQLVYSKLDFLNGAFALVGEELDGFETTLDLPAFDLGPRVDPRWLLEHLIRPSFYTRRVDLARGQRKARRVNPPDFLAARLLLPPLEEQRRIADAITLIQEDLSLSETHLDALKRQKRGLMQKLLTGEWRVPAEPAV